MDTTQLTLQNFHTLFEQVRPHISVQGKITIRSCANLACSALVECFDALLADIGKAPHSTELEQLHTTLTAGRELLRHMSAEVVLSLFPDQAQATTEGAQQPE